MSITDYASLRSTVYDITLKDSDKVPLFVMLFEARVNRRLRVRQMEATAALTPDAAGIAALPTDFLEKRRLTWQGGARRELEYVTPSQLVLINPAGAGGPPDVFTIEGGTIKLAPVSSIPLELDYWQKIPALSDATPTNWLLTGHPDLYLAGTLVEAFMYSRNADMASLWNDREAQMIAEIQRLDANAVGSVAIRTTSYTP